MEEITIEELYELLCNKLDSMSGLTELYVGITDDIVRRSEEHKKEYMYTKEIAFGTPNIISKAEKYLINKFKTAKTNWILKNEGEGGEGTSTANKLYISYNYDTSKMKDINELDDDDLELSNYKLI